MPTIVEKEAPRFRDIFGVLERRRFLQLMAASMALGGLSACGPETNPRQLLPYVVQPAGIVPGRARYYATATTNEGFATGVMVAHQMARPVKVEGNPDHPASLGAASAIMQASILGLYDPRRAQTHRRPRANRHLGKLSDAACSSAGARCRRGAGRACGC